MIKYLIASAAVVVAGVPAAFGLAGNASFTRDIPVRVPAQVQLTPAASSDDGTADQGHGDAPGSAGAGDAADQKDDHGVDDSTPGSDDGTADQGRGDAPGTEPGDDRGGSTRSGSGSSGSGSSGSASSGSGSSGSGGGGSDDATADDSGHHGGGSDDGSGHQ